MNNAYEDLEQKYADNLKQQNDMLGQQSQIQKEQSQANTNQLVNEIEQQKQWANQDFSKEAKSAYTDYQKKINPYGVQAEQTYAKGLGNSGYSESSDVSAYNTYQNRYATAKSTTDRIQSDFTNKINQAKLSGNKELAEIAINELQQKMSNLWNELNFNSTLTQNKVTQDNWLNQFNYQKQQDELAQQNWLKEFEYQKQQNAISNQLARAKTYTSTVNPFSSNNNNEQDSLSSIGQSWYQKLKNQEQKFGRNSTEYEIKTGLEEALKYNLINESDANLILSEYGY